MRTRYSIVKVRGYDNLIASRERFYIYDIDNFGLWLHNRETDEVVRVPHKAVLCYWFKGQWVYPATKEVCI